MRSYFALIAILLTFSISYGQGSNNEKKIIGTWISVETKFEKSNITLKSEVLAETTYTPGKQVIVRIFMPDVKFDDAWFDYVISGNDIITTNYLGEKHFSTILELTDKKLVEKFIDKSGGGEEIAITTYKKKL